MPGDAASGIWALASTNTGRSESVVPSASHTAPRFGQNLLRGDRKRILEAKLTYGR